MWYCGASGNSPSGPCPSTSPNPQPPGGQPPPTINTTDHDESSKP